MAGFGKTTRGTSQLLFRAGLEANMLEAYTEYPPIYNRIMKTGTTNQVEIQRTRMAGPNRMFRSYEGEPPILSKITVAPKFTAVDRTYQGGYGVTIEAREDDLYGKLDKGGMYLGHAARLTMEYLVAAFLDDSFAGSAGYVGMDNLPLFSASHTMIGGPTGVLSNLVASPVALSVAGLTAMLQLFRDMKDENGDPIQSWPDTLIIPNNVGIEMDAIRILNQTNSFGTANRDDNGIKAVLDRKINIIVNPYMTSTSAYFLVDSKLNDAHFLTRKGLTVRQWEDDSTQDMFVATRMRVLSYFYNWRGWVGSNPT